MRDNDKVGNGNTVGFTRVDIILSCMTLDCKGE